MRNLNYNGSGHVFEFVALPGDTGGNIHVKVAEEPEEYRRRCDGLQQVLDYAPQILRGAEWGGRRGVLLERYNGGNFFLHFDPHLLDAGYEMLSPTMLTAFTPFFGVKEDPHPFERWARGFNLELPLFSLARLIEFLKEQRAYWRHALTHQSPAPLLELDPQELTAEILSLEEQLAAIPQPHRGREFTLDPKPHLIEETPY